MRKLTEGQINKLVRPKNESTGVDEITVEMLESIDLDKLPKVVRETRSWSGDFAVVLDNGQCFSRDKFQPRAGSYAFKPSFAGSQVLIGLWNGEVLFSNGVWFSNSPID